MQDAVSGTVLVLAQPGDATAAAVSNVLANRNFHIEIVDLRDFPLGWSYTASLLDQWKALIRRREDGHSVDLADLAGIYVRRPGLFRFGPALSETATRFAIVEARAGVLGSLMSLTTRWVNHPAAEHVANFKPLQLALAKQVGLDPPDTLITNSRGAAADFVQRYSNSAVYKEMGHYLSEDPASLPLPITRLVSTGDLSESVEVTANLFQERVRKVYDVRLIVAGQQQFAVSIASDSGALDWRRDKGVLKYEQVDAPAAVVEASRALLDRFNLVYGAFDFAVTPEGSWRFLEVNPNGQWLWLQRALGLPIAEALATALTDTPPRSLP
jgi:glutathione synthase/RimK-type ligase-like ATP-grasp enzyme